MTVQRSGTVVLLAGLLMVGCSSSEGARKDQEIAELAERWQRAERELADSINRTARLREALKQVQGEAAAAADQLKRAGENLNQTKDGQAQLAAKVKGLEEKNYDLEMAYGNLMDQIRELKSQLSSGDERLLEAKQAIREGKDELRRREDDHAKTMSGAQREAEELKVESRRLKGEVESLKGDIEKSRERNQLLERRAAELEVVRADAMSLAAEKRSLEALQQKSSEQVKRLEARMARLMGVVQTAGVSLPADIEAPSDWEVLKRVTATRFRLAASGRLQGDIVDGVLFGGLVLGVLLMGSTLVATLVAIRSRRKLRSLLGAGAVPIAPQAVGSAYAGEEETPPTDGGEYDDGALAMESSPPASGVAEEEPPAGEPERSAGFDEIEGLETFDGEMTEVLETVGAEAPPSRQAARRNVEDDSPDLSRTQVIDDSFSPSEKKAKPKQAGDEDILGDLRSVINKKFDELLEG